MRSIRVVHIHTDEKFIDDSKRFENEFIDNTIIYLGKDLKYKGHFKDSILNYGLSKKSYKRIINKCKLVDLVVLYDLNFPKSYIANRLPDDVIILWRFFGLELYNKMPNVVYSKLTHKHRRNIANNNLSFKVKDYIKSIFYFIGIKANPQEEFEQAAFNRVDYFLGLSKVEYKFLKTHWPKLPSFLQIGFAPYAEKNIMPKTKKNLVIIGNNRSAYNNHLDIIEGLKKIGNKYDYRFLLLFNYGQNNEYSNAVRLKAKEIKAMQVLEEYLPIEKFKQVYSNTVALVINGQRQMAMYNIFEALSQNTKVYLNVKNIMYSWLIKEGFKVFTIDDFYKDLQFDSVYLTKEEIILNQEQFVEMTNKYSIENLHSSIKRIVSES